MQERLRLSARMLKAFQSQIARVDESRDKLDQQERMAEKAQASMDESLEEFEHHLSERLEKFELHMNRMADRSIDRYEKHLQEKRDDLAQIELQITEAQKRANVTLNVAEEVEATVTRLAHHTAENAALIETRTAEAKASVNRELARVTKQTDQALANLETSEATLKELHIALEDISQRARNDVAASEKHLDEAGVRCRGIRCALESKLDQCHEAEKEFQQRFVELTDLVDSLDVDAKTHESLRDLLIRLEPWRNLLIRDGGEQAGLPESVATMIDELKADIGSDMKRLSGVMADVAKRIDRSGLTRSLASEMAEFKLDASMTPPEVGATIETIEIETANRDVSTD
ncbi:MAG: hypothetical protein O7G85_13025 [Planctomycetota bacterium]|nr:hypothetical protein [Planctomycetota bacterium]